MTGNEEETWKAKIYPESSLDEITVTVTQEDIKRGVVEFECPSCQGTGKAFWHPDYPEGEGPDCIPCSTRGTQCASI